MQVIIVQLRISLQHTIKNKPPTSSATKLEITNWLTTNNINYDATALKLQLLDLVERFKPPPRYEADELAEKYGHAVLRLPPYHCIFNPIELIWGITKRSPERFSRLKVLVIGAGPSGQDIASKISAIADKFRLREKLLKLHNKKTQHNLLLQTRYKLSQ
ncbi:hypothetical protein QE152_g26108 [Popillia japonica]|uniref:Uncharacterized protein n=1 Tax=Popillia japonica TaxID=7064 RepID=A0AAW1JYD1_POPJA